MKNELKEIIKRGQDAAEILKKIEKIEAKILAKNAEIEAIDSEAEGIVGKLRVKLCTQREILVQKRLEEVAIGETL